MLAMLACLLSMFACHRVDPVPAAVARPMAMRAVGARPVLLTATCTLSRRASAISCVPAAPAPRTDDSTHVARSPAGRYGEFLATNLVQDSVRQVWSFDASLHNSLGQAIGTLDGTSVTGSDILVTAIRATQGTGAVSVINADGVAHVTAPNQPCFAYDQIVASGAHSTAKRWELRVPNTVATVSLDILVTTDFPAEQSVALLPPDTVPSWVRADTNIAPPTDSSPGHFAKRIVIVVFRPTATLADRQLAIAFVNGVVVGGMHSRDGSIGTYYVKVPDDASENGVFAAMQALDALPQVQFATLYVYLDELSSPN